MPPSLLAELWVIMLGLYGHTWASQYGTEPDDVTGDIWARGMAGVTRAQMMKGVDGALAEGSSFPPSAPRFRALCLQVPSFETVRDMIRDTIRSGGTRTPFAQEVWSRIDTYRFRNAPADAGDKLLHGAYVATAEHVMRGGGLPDILPAIGSDESWRRPTTPTDERIARTEMDKIAAALGG